MVQELKFNQGGNECATLKTNYNNPADLILQHLPVKEKVKNIEVIRIRNGYTIDTLACVDIQEIVKIGEKVIEFYEDLFIKKLQNVTFKKIMEKLFSLR